MRIIEASMSRRSFLQTSAAAIGATSVLGLESVFAQTGTAITPFKYKAPQSALDDLKQRLANTRWPESETVSNWSQGVPLARLHKLVEYWRTQYDWRRFEKTLSVDLRKIPRLD